VHRRFRGHPPLRAKILRHAAAAKAGRRAEGMAETQGDRIDVGGGVVGGAGGGGRDGGEQHHGGVHLRVHGGAVPVPRRRPPPRGEQVGQRVHHRAHHRTPDQFITQYY